MKKLTQLVQEKLQISRYKKYPPLKPGEFYCTLGIFYTWYTGEQDFDDINFTELMTTADLWFYLYQDDEPTKVFNNYKEVVDFVIEHKDVISVFWEDGDMIGTTIDDITFEEQVSEDFPDELKIDPKTL
mgnify:CR=1 FL=1